MFSYNAVAANQGPQTITVDGRLFTSLTSDTALIDPSVVIDVKIYNGAGTCVLYEEKQTIDTTATDGRFTILVGSATGSAKRVTGEPGNAMVAIFQNTLPIAGSCGAYSPSSGETRLIRLTVAPSTTGSVEVLSPDTTIDSVPNAMVAESLQGLDRDHVLAIDSTTTLNQSNVANVFSATNYPILTSLLAGTNSSYVTSGTSGAKIPTVAGTPGTLAAGQIWFSSSANAFQFYNGSSIQTVGVSGAGISSITVGSSLTAAGVTGGTLSGPGTIDLVNSGVTAGTYPKVTVNSKGFVTYGSGLAEADIPTLATPGHVLGNAITSGTIGGTTAFNTSGNVTTTGTVQGNYVSSTYDLTRKLSIYGTGGTNSISFMAPVMASDYTVVFPAVQGGVGTTLINDGSGNLSWVLGSSGSVTSVGLALPSIFSVTTPLVTSTGNLTASLVSQNANLIFAGPSSGVATAPTFRGLTVSDLPAGYDASVMKNALASGRIWIGNSAGLATAVTPFGDVTLSVAGSGTVTALQGSPVSATSPTGAGQILRWSGSAWVPNFLAMSDLRSTVTGAQSLATCTASQTLVFNSVSDSLACSSIQIANSQIIWAATGANLIFAGPATGGAASPTFRAIASTDLPANAYDSTYFKQNGNGFGAGAVLGTTDAQSLSLITAGNSRLAVSSGGLVGVGTVSPQALLDVYGTGTSSAMLIPRDSTVNRPTGINGMLRYNTSNAQLETYSSGAWNSVSTSATGGGASQWISSGSNIFYGSGSVGIGTSIPSQALDVAGSINIGNTLYAANHTTIAGSALTFTTGIAPTATSVGNAINLTAGIGGSTNGDGGAVNITGGTGTDAHPGGAINILSGPTSYGNSGGSAVNITAANATNTGTGGQVNLTAGSATGFGVGGALVLTGGNGVNGNGGAISLTAGTSTTNTHPGGNISLTAGTASGTNQQGGNIVISGGTPTGSALPGYILLAAGNVGVGTSAPQAILDINGSGTAQSAMIVPRDSTAMRPTGVNGMLRYNTTSAQLETYSSGNWNGLATSTSVGSAYLPLSGGTMTGAIAHLNGSATAPGISFADTTSGFYSAGAGNVTATTSGVARLQINSAGNISIGTTNASALLTLGSTGGASVDLALNRGNADIGTTPSSYAPSDEGRLKFYQSAFDGYRRYFDMIANGATGNQDATIRFFTNAGAGSAYERMRVSGAGNVGVGTTSPQALLDVNGTGNASAMLVPRDSTAMRPTGINGMIRYNTTNAQLETYSSGAWAGLATGSSGGGSSQWTTSGSNIYYNSTGNVGIGTSNPVLALDVATGSGHDVLIGRDTGAASYNTISLNGTTGDTPNAMGLTGGGDSNLYVNAPTGGAVVLRANGNSGGSNSAGLVTISGSQSAFMNGNLGVGTNAPTAALHVLANSTGGTAKLQNTNSAGYVSADLVDAGGNAKAGFGWGNSGASSWTSSAYFNTTGTDPVVLGTNSLERLRVTGVGNVGVGTTSPQALLDVYGTGTSQSAMIVPRDSTTNRPTGINGMLRYNTTNAQLETYSSGAWAGLATSASGGVASQWTSSGSNIYYLSGNVGIGTSNPTTKLSVVSGANGMNVTPGWLSGGGTWIDLDTNGPSGIGNGGAGSNAWIAYAYSNTQWFADSQAGDLIYRNANSKRMLLGIDNGSGNGLSLLKLSANNVELGSSAVFNVDSAGVVGGRVSVTTGGNVGVGTTSPQAILDLNGSGAAQSAMLVPRDSTVNRPTGINGMLRYNTTNAQLETYSSGAWAGLSTAGATISGSGTTGTLAKFSSGNILTNSMLMDDGTHIGIGTTVANSTLDVNGNIRLEGATSGSSVIQAPAIAGSSTKFQLPSNTGSSGYVLQTDGSGVTSWISPTTSVAAAIAPSVSVNIGVTNQTVATAVWTKLRFNTKVFDTNNNFDTSSYRYTPTIAGKYLVSLTAECSDSVNCAASVYKNGVIANNSSGAFYFGTATAVLDMNGTSDYIEGYVYNYSGTTILGAASATYMSASLLAPLASGAIAGTGTASYVPMWSSSTNITNSPIAISAASVGVGTTSPQAILDIAGSGTNSALLVPRATIAQRPTTPVNGMIRYQIDNQTLEAYANGAWSALGGSGSGGASQWVAITGGIAYSSGNVAIGTTSTSSLFDVYQNSASDLSAKFENVYSGKATNLLTYANSLYSTHEFQGQPGADWKIGLFGTTNFVAYDPNNNTYPFQIEKAAPTSSLYINSSGYVGVGTSSPGTTLSVSGSPVTPVTVNSTSGAGSLIGFTTSGTNRGYVGYNLGGTAGLEFQSAANTSLMRLTDAGNVGFGTTSPVNKLDVNGTARVGSTSLSAVNGVALTVIHSGAGTQYGVEIRPIASGGTTPIIFTNYVGSVMGSITNNGSGTTNFNTTSDYRLKENVVPLDGALSRLSKLEPKRFDYKADPDHRTIDGFIAHEVQAVIPEAVTGAKDAVDKNGKPVFQQLDLSKIVPLITASVRELAQKTASFSRGENGFVGIGTASPRATLDVNGHIANSASGTPTLSNCGSATIVGNDTRGTVTSAVAGCTVNFATAYASAPFCVVSAKGDSSASVTMSLASPTVSAFSVNTNGILSFTYICMQ